MDYRALLIEAADLLESRQFAQGQYPESDGEVYCYDCVVVEKKRSASVTHAPDCPVLRVLAAAQEAQAEIERENSPEARQWRELAAKFEANLAAAPVNDYGMRIPLKLNSK